MIQADSMLSMPRTNSPSIPSRRRFIAQSASNQETEQDCDAIIQYAELLCMLASSGDVDLPIGINRILWQMIDHARAIQARYVPAEIIRQSQG